jgi:hypothetical protein
VLSFFGTKKQNGGWKVIPFSRLSDCFFKQLKNSGCFQSAA